MKTKTWHIEDAMDLKLMLEDIQRETALSTVRLEDKDGGMVMEATLHAETLTDGSTVYNMRLLANTPFQKRA